MKVVVAPDSFKGSLTAIEAANMIKQGITEIIPEAEIMLKPMADGGEGTLDSLSTATASDTIPIRLTGPLGKPIDTNYRILPGKTAVIETAAIAGLIQVPNERRNPDYTTSYGIGEAILDAMNEGCHNFIIGLGGSATNDGGLGMLQALGMQAYDEKQQPVDKFGKDLQQITHIDLSALDPRLKQININLACDVDNPLCGKRGASAVYGPQKGATKTQVSQYDTALNQYSALIEKELGFSYKNQEGAGAAGGLGFAFLTLHASLTPGAALIAKAIELESTIRHADLVITGEGQSDEQTLYGKAPGYIAKLANPYKVPAILISGSISGGEDKLRTQFTGCFSTINSPMSLDTCIDNAAPLLLEKTKQVMHFFKNMHGI